MNKKILLSGSFLLSVGTFASYLLGAVRDAVFGNFFGISSETDAYLSAFLVADILMMIFISSALLGIATPLFLREQEKDEKNAQKVFGNFFSTLLLIFAGALLISGFFAEGIFAFLFPSLFAENPEKLVEMGRLFLLSNFLFAVSNFLGTFLMAHKYFLSTALAPLLYNIGILTGILFFADIFGILSAAYGAVFGAFLHMLSRIIEYLSHVSSKKINTFSPNLDLNDPILKELFISMLWKMGGLVIVPLTFLFFVRITESSEGLYTAFQYMRNLQSAAVAIFGISLATAIFPVLSKNAVQHNSKEFDKNFWNTFSSIFYWTLPSSIGLFFLGSEVLSLIYGIEKNTIAFEWIEILVFFLAGILVFEALFHLISRSFYASKDISSPLLGGGIFLITALGTLVAGKIFFPEYLVYFLGGAYFLGYFSQTIFLFWRAKQKALISFSFGSYSCSKTLQQKIFSTLFWSGILGIFLWITQLFPENFQNFQNRYLDTGLIIVLSFFLYFLPNISPVLLRTTKVIFQKK